MKKLLITLAFLLVGTPSSFALINNVNSGANEFQDLRNWRNYIEEVRQTSLQASDEDIMRWRKIIAKRLKGETNNIENRMRKKRQKILQNPYLPNNKTHFNWLYYAKSDIDTAKDFLKKSYKNYKRYPFTENRKINSYEKNPQNYLGLNTNSSERMKYRLQAYRSSVGRWNWDNDADVWWDWTDLKNRLEQKKQIEVNSTEAE